ncbi:ADP-ribose pyrophosphatase YjhB (NUDIX family) [Nocardiopsis sp. Huas11]|uniref:NUDIX domain-containing protein n=1 Tax=Nocardiopsis sp. Huas11 TaxID=2183912 RepID=UPI000EB52525|nr:NUDIX hydrolase [Nocardiopsis sp. Huas11]RKS07032.1 ADP-ribose pyrophosphatase YjhB (NUDIX family) [Nocardiopsis sp. Huas11]
MGEGESPLYLRDPAAWRKQLAEGNRRQARKRVASEVILHDETGRLLLVDPSYKPYWDIPGGMAEANEPPALAAVRELREELRLDLSLGTLLCVDWVAPHGPWDDLLMFVFDGGTLPASQAASLYPADEELREVRWCTYQQAEELLRGDVWRRTRAALEVLAGGGPLYLQEGRPVTGS